MNKISAQAPTTSVRSIWPDIPPIKNLSNQTITATCKGDKSHINPSRTEYNLTPCLNKSTSNARVNTMSAKNRNLSTGIPMQFPAVLES
jgi:hypothetical protein